jgi:transcriptional regulator with XRE-family HTH domain
MEASLADIIRDARLSSGKTQKELADLIGVSQATISQWESGINQPSLANRIDLSATLMIPFHKLLPEVRHPNMIDSPEALSFVHSFEQLPPQYRQIVLMLIAQLQEAMKAGQQARSVKK